MNEIFVYFLFLIFNRISIDHTAHDTVTKLNVKSVQVHDEGVYSCTATYLNPIETCHSLDSHKTTLNVLGKSITLNLLLFFIIWLLL